MRTWAYRGRLLSDREWRGMTTGTENLGSPPDQSTRPLLPDQSPTRTLLSYLLDSTSVIILDFRMDFLHLWDPTCQWRQSFCTAASKDWVHQVVSLCRYFLQQSFVARPMESRVTSGLSDRVRFAIPYPGKFTIGPHRTFSISWGLPDWGSMQNATHKMGFKLVLYWLLILDILDVALDYSKTTINFLQRFIRHWINQISVD